MIEPAELFARITGQLEDLHGIAVEGQRANLSPDENCVYADQISNGLQNIGEVVRILCLENGSNS
ncbi:hypothetical protein GCM10023115_00430 [Pontixanthobacter gangjinensis]|uniref:Uncharacterized protein n=1 Tax=Pontixanthobacter gangjinensis TaxID=1028742 RepID=A0A6I4SKJ5_9SPHN|nr:hypothetical protein [Pontixanthobacter gangjinensis]MXO55297.1 hypothetical protein [Pontixanthobacter gangjinensis]